MDNFFKKVKRRLEDGGPFIFLCYILRYVIIKLLSLKHFFYQKFLKIITKNQFIEKEILGSKMLLDLADTGISRELLINKIREPFITEKLSKEISAGDVVVDIGANIGYYVFQEARLTGSTGKVYAIEPVLENFELLNKNIALNNYSNIETFQLAIGDENKITDIYLSEKRNLSSMVKSEELVAIKGKIQVKMITLDKFFEGRNLPNLIRMDVEGYEFEIIKGMDNILRSGVPLKIFVEIHPFIMKEKTKEFLAILKKYGFVAKVVVRELNFPLRRKSKIFMPIVNALNKKIDFEFGHLNLSIDDLLNDKLLIQGKKGGLEIIFKR